MAFNLITSGSLYLSCFVKKKIKIQAIHLEYIISFLSYTGMLRNFQFDVGFSVGRHTDIGLGVT